MLEIENLLKNMNIIRIIQYGNTDIECCDYDLIVVSDSFQDMYNHKRVSICKKYLVSDKSLDLICLTELEFHKLIENPSTFSIEIIRKGEVLYGKEN